MTDDSDLTSCGDFVSFKALLQFNSMRDGANKLMNNELNLVKLGGDTGICSGKNYYPGWRGTKTFPNIPDTVFNVGFGGIDDDTPWGQLANYGLGIAWGSSPTNSKVRVTVTNSSQSR
jgi:hypothetical protein